jgi:uncharacterized membrane protein YeaQ/YmgE (transglycosylase-associated protein family)
VLGFIFIGLVVGVLARVIAPGRHQLGLLMTLAVGLVGSIIGGVVASSIGTGEIGDMDLLGGIVAVASGAVLVALVSAGNSRRSVSS